jgi:flagellar biosynthesis/type III secretory pathway protein FliH
MNRLFFVPAVAVVGLVLASPASAQFAGTIDLNRQTYTDEARQPYNESRRVAYDNGYREGIREGEREARSRNAFNYQDERTWQRADKGYHRSFGDSVRYQQSFRTGYAAGYSDGYRRYAPDYGYRGNGNGGVYPNTRGGYPSQGGYGYPGQGGYGAPAQGRYGYSPAYSNGTNDGYEKGREDARDRDSYDPLRHKWYREGDHDYKSQYGPRQQYENVYREGFKEGYDRGYREWAYRR